MSKEDKLILTADVISCKQKNANYAKLNLRIRKIHHEQFKDKPLPLNMWKGNKIKIYWSPSFRERRKDLKTGLTNPKVLLDLNPKEVKESKLQKKARKLGVRLG